MFSVSNDGLENALEWSALWLNSVVTFAAIRLIPMFPTSVAGAAETSEFERIAKLPAVPRSTGIESAALAPETKKDMLRNNMDTR
jgi:hypothetical protein